MSLAQLYNSSMCGSFPATGATPVVIANASVTTDSIILLQRVGGGAVSPAFVSAITNGVSFAVTSTGGDTSTYRYIILPSQPQ